MLILVPLLLAAVFAYLWWQRRRSGLSRLCRWRQERAAGRWRCAACGAVVVDRGDLAPTICLRRG